MKTIRVSEEVWRRLQVLKIDNGLKSMDEVLRFLLDNYDECNKKAMEEIVHLVSGEKKS